MEKINPETPKSPSAWVLVFLACGLVAILSANQGDNLLQHFTDQNKNQDWTKTIAAPVDPNTASLAELILIPSLGKKLADEIISFRKTKTIKNINDLSLIPGFGENRLSKLAVWFHFPEDSPLKFQVASKENSQSIANPNNAVADRKMQIKLKINPNKASQIELEQVPGIGPKLAVKIISTREINPFSSLEDLIRAPGIGPKNLERFRPYLEVMP